MTPPAVERTVSKRSQSLEVFSQLPPDAQAKKTNQFGLRNQKNAAEYIECVSRLSMGGLVGKYPDEDGCAASQRRLSFDDHATVRLIYISQIENSWL